MSRGDKPEEWPSSVVFWAQGVIVLNNHIRMNGIGKQ